MDINFSKILQRTNFSKLKLEQKAQHVSSKRNHLKNIISKYDPETMAENTEAFTSTFYKPIDEDIRVDCFSILSFQNVKFSSAH